MTSRDFVFWLQGLFELAEPDNLNEKQTELIRKHLNLVFFHEIDPSYTDDNVKQSIMNEIHSGNHITGEIQTSPQNGDRNEEGQVWLNGQWNNVIKPTTDRFAESMRDENGGLLRC